jgi:hypothetical protein
MTLADRRTHLEESKVGRLRRSPEHLTKSFATGHGMKTTVIVGAGNGIGRAVSEELGRSRRW